MKRTVRPLLPVAMALAATGCAMATSPTSDTKSASNTAADAGPWVVDFVDGTSLDTARTVLGDESVDWFHPRADDDAIMVVDHLSPAQRDRLTQAPSLEVLEPSMEYAALGYPDDPMRDRQWNFDTVGASSGWRLGGGDGVVVAVIDTGVTQVPDLAGTALLEGVSFVRGEETAADGNGHGTHVAGTIAQTTHNGLGVAGLAPNATILPLKALSATGSGRSEWVAAAIDEAGDQGAQIINLSLGGPRSAVIARAVEKAQRRGILVVAAAGNSGREGVGSPAVLPGVVAVSATGPTDERAPYSTFGPEVVLSAPGGDKTRAGGGILQDTVSRAAKDGHAFLEFQGTSMATPHVAGAAAVVWGATGGGADHVASVLTGSSVDLGAPGRDTIFGHGRLDIEAAARAVVVERGVAFGIAGLLAWLVSGMVSGARGRGRAILAAAVTAGGVFALPLLPMAPAAWADLLSRPLLLWADPVLGMGWSRNPLVLSAVLPVLSTFLLAPSRRFGPWVAGLSVGIGAHLLHGAVTGSLAPTWLPGILGSAWLAAHGLISLGAAIAAFGVQRMHHQSGDSA